MKNKSQKNQKTKRANRLSFKALVVLFVFGHIFLGLAKLGLQNYEKQKQYQALQRELQKIQKSNEQYRKKIQDIKTEEEIEREARKLGLIKPGEIPFRVIKSPGKKEK